LHGHRIGDRFGFRLGGDHNGEDRESGNHDGGHHDGEDWDGRGRILFRDGNTWVEIVVAIYCGGANKVRIHF
jgi:hypothetical protein